MISAFLGANAVTFDVSLITPRAASELESVFLPAMGYGFAFFLTLAYALAWYGHQFQPKPNLGLYGEIAFGLAPQ